MHKLRTKSLSHLRTNRLNKHPLVLRLACVSVLGACLSVGPVIGGQANTSQDGEFRFTYKDAWFGQLAEIKYQTTPRLSFTWQAQRLDGSGSEVSRPELTRYDARFALLEHVEFAGQRFNLDVGIDDFADTAYQQSTYALIHTHLGNQDQWGGYLGVATGDGRNGLQAGVSYTLPEHLLVLHADYHAQKDWHSSSVTQVLHPAPQWSIGAQWRPYPWLSVSATHDEVKAFGLGLSLYLDSQAPVTRRSSVNTDIATDGDTAALFDSQTDTNAFVDSLSALLAELDVDLDAVNQENGLLQLVIHTNAYSYWPDAISTVHNHLSVLLPHDIKDIEYIVAHQGHVQYSVRMALNHLLKRASHPNWQSSHSQIRLNSVSPEQLALAQAPKPAQQPHVSFWEQLVPELSADVVHQVYTATESPLYSQDKKFTQYMGADVTATWSFNPTLSIQSSIRLDLADADVDDGDMGANLVQESRHAETLLPIRSSVVHNQQDARGRLNQLALVKRGTALRHHRLVSDSIHYRVALGLVSQDLMGLNSQWLYQPWQSRVAFGASIARLQAAGELESLSVDSGLISDTSESMTLTSAIVSGYWATPWHNIDIAVHAGRFVGQDTGAQVQIKRTFHNGWQFGLWSSHTEKDGHSYHDYGIALQIPLEGLLDTLMGTSKPRKVRLQSSIRDPFNNAGVLPTELGSGRDSDIWWQQRDVRFDVFSERY